MFATLGTVGINLVLSPIFIFALDMGVSGAAWATILAQFVMLIWEIKLFMDQNQLVHFSREVMHLEKKIVWDSLIIGLPQFLVKVCACLVAIIITRSMSEYGGDVSVGAFGICNLLAMFVVLIVIGLNQGMQPIAGYNFGAKRNDRVLSVVKLTAMVATCVTTFGFAIGMFFAEPCVAVFAKDSPELIAEASHGLRIYVMFFPVIGIQIVSTAFFQSIGLVKRSIFLSLTRQLILLLPVLLILPHFFEDPTDGVWYAQPLSDVLSTMLSVILLYLQMKKLKRSI